MAKGSSDGTLRLWACGRDPARYDDGHQEWVTPVAMRPTEAALAPQRRRTLRLGWDGNPARLRCPAIAMGTAVAIEQGWLEWPAAAATGGAPALGCGRKPARCADQAIRIG